MKTLVKRLNDASGTEIVVRQPVIQDDLNRLVEFFGNLPAEERNYLRYHVTDRELVRQRLQQVDGTNHWRLIMECGGEIIADGTLDREPFQWTRHVAEVRAVFSERAKQLQVGPHLFNELVELGSAAGIELLFTEVMEEQKELIAMLQEAGFAYELIRKRYAKDMHGDLHDVIIMSNDLGSVWKHLTELIEEMELRHSRDP